MADSRLFESEVTAAHKAIEAFFNTLVESLDNQGMPSESMLELSDTKHVHHSVLFHPQGAVAVRMSIQFSRSDAAVQAAMATMRKS